jgi:segregation and condensation protein B
LNSAAQALTVVEATETSLDSDGDSAEAIGAEPGSPVSAEGDERVNPAQVIEALVFVGGQPLTAKAIGTLLRDEAGTGLVEEAIDELNRRYARQNRPYEIRLADGGYRIVLRREFEPLRNRVYGFGPKQVRLSQDTLEMLALVAYRQPISRSDIEKTSRRSAGAQLRQLLQRELLVLDRGSGTEGSEVLYRTSPRFLQLFGLGRLEELPQIEDIDFK